jgi:hypothetical protein
LEAGSGIGKFLFPIETIEIEITRMYVGYNCGIVASTVPV